MTLSLKAALIVTLCAVLLAQQTKLSDTVRAAYFKAKSLRDAMELLILKNDAIQANNRAILEKLNSDLKDKEGDLRKACNGEFTLDKDQEPVCK